VKGFLLVALFIMSFNSFTQDERYYRKIFTDELINRPEEVVDFKVEVESPTYQIDLNGDHFNESIRVEKKDGLDFIKVFDKFGRKILEKRLESIGFKSHLFKIQLRSITKDVNALILHFYEGKIESTKFESTARIYFISFLKSKLEEMHVYKGPHFFHEKEKVDSQYWSRRYSVNTIDYNNDGINEISISYNKISRIFFYVGEGVWRRF